MKILDNITNTVRDDLRVEIKKGSRVSIAAACFSMYAYKELKKQLETIDEFEFIFTSPTFVKEKVEKQKREFYIPRISRETSLYGTEFEIKLRNEMTQRAIAKECADWIRRKATFKSNTTGENMAGFMTVDSGAAQTAYMPIGGFTTVDIGCERGNNSYNMVNCMEAPFAQQYMKLFDTLWNDRDKMQDVTDVVLENISTAYAENSPEFIYFMTLYHLINDSGFKNEALQLTDQELLQNIRALQAEANIHQSDKLVAPLGRCSLDIEMETGTGKTYVYIKTMFELNKRYGWSKFIVVVPSIAIREGVKKSFEITADHFMECYGKKARFFIYNSSNLNQLDSFSSNSGINVMIINTQAFAASMNEDKNVEGRKGDAAARIIYTKRDEFGSRRPIDVIAANRPILILDEPQKMGKEDSATQKALKKFNPLFTLNYSATHAKQHNLIYVLDALDAYNKRLVKKIEVKGFEVKNLRGTDKYLYLESIIISPKNPPRAKVEMEVSYQNGTKREFHMLDVGDNLYYKSGEMEQYKGFVVSEIDPITGVVTFTNGDTIRKGDVTGDVSENDMRRVQIHETILSHFEKEQELFKLGIKTLSLFFIDEVAKYRQYDEDGNELLGEYGKIFEQEYLSVLNEHRTLFDPAYTAYLDSTDVHDVHKGYFSIDKKGHSVNSSVKRGSDMSDDISAYDTIEGSYDSSIFTAEKHALTMDKAYKAQKAIQDYVFTDGTAEKSVERKFAENLDGAEEVFIYAKLPKGFYIPTPVGHYSPDWAIVFHEGKVKHIYFVAETKGTMESLNLRPIEKSKIDCAKKLFAKLSDGLVTYDHVDSYQELMNKVLQ